MDDELSSALARLVLVAGSVSKAQEHLRGYSVAEQNSVVLPQFLLLPATNPWQEQESPDLVTLDPPRSNVTSRRRNAGDRAGPDNVSQCGGADRVLASGSPVERYDWAHTETRSPTTPVRSPSTRIPSSVTSLRPLPSDTAGPRTPSPFSSPLSTMSRGLDRSLHHERGTPTHLTSEGSNHHATRIKSRVRPPPVTVSEMVDSLPIQRYRESGRRGLHPELAVLTPQDSRLSEKAFEEVKAKIREDTEYLGERCYIKIVNPNLEIKKLIHYPPPHGSKWYIVTSGRAIGIFNSWGPANAATVGVKKNHHQSFTSREQAIVEYQRLLLQGQVTLTNEKEG